MSSLSSGCPKAVQYQSNEKMIDELGLPQARQRLQKVESRLPYFDYVSRILGAHKRHLLLRWICQQPAHRPVLEFRSGIGTFARQLGQRGYQVAAVDISAAKTVKARRLTAQRAQGRRPMVRHFVGDLRHLGTNSDLDLEIQRAYHWSALLPFDVLLAADVLEHVPDSTRSDAAAYTPPLSTKQPAFHLCAIAAVYQ